MFTNAISFLLSTLLNLLSILFLLRFYMQLVRAPFQNQIGQMVMTLTDFAVKPLRKIIPSLKKLDLSTLILAIVTQLILRVGLLYLSQFPLAVAGETVWINVFGLALLSTLRLMVDILFYSLLLQAILSWVNPLSAAAPILNLMTNPILKPIRRFVPIANGIDFSPFVAMILLQMVNISFVIPLEKHLNSVF
jgi:YggT family protein